MRLCILWNSVLTSLGPSPPPQLSSLAVQITRRRSGENYHVMYATVYGSISTNYQKYYSSDQLGYVWTVASFPVFHHSCSTNNTKEACRPACVDSGIHHMIILTRALPQLSSLAVQITRRRSGENYHVMYATVYGSISTNYQKYYSSDQLGYVWTVASFPVFHHSCSTNNTKEACRLAGIHRQWHTSHDNSHQGSSTLFVLQVTMAVVEDWERGYVLTTWCIQLS